MDEKRNKLTALDSFMCFMYSLVMPILFSAAFTVIVVVLSYVSQVEYEIFINQWLIKGVTYVLNSATFLFIFIYYYKKNSISFKNTINYTKNYNVYSVLITIALSIVLVFGFSNFIGLLDHIYALVGYIPSSDLPIKINTVENMLISIVLWAVIPAVCEELLFRGIIFKGLTTKFKPIYAMLIGGALFMLMHGSLQQTVYQFVLGVVLCFVYYKTNNIFYPILLHFINNTIVIMLEYFIEVYRFSIDLSYLSAGGVILSIVIMLVAVCGVLALLYLLHKVNANKYQHVVSTEYEVMEKSTSVRLNKWMIWSIAVAVVIWLSNTIATWIE